MIDERKIKNSWICEIEKIILSSNFVEVIEQTCRSSEDERKFKFFLFRSKDWCNIIPVTEEGKVVFVSQYRIGISAHTLEIPGGGTDLGDQDFQSAAIREMQEETGYFPMPGASCVPLGWAFPNPAIMNNRCHSFIIGPVKKLSPQKLDPGEMIETVEIPISEIPERIISGEINHALMLNTFFFIALKSPEASKALVNELGRFRRTQP